METRNGYIMPPIKITMIAGFSDLDIAGNQSTKNALLQFERLGYEVDFWSAFPSKFPNLLDPNSLFGPSIRFHRLPNWTERWLMQVKRFKDIAARQGEEGPTVPQEVESYHQRMGTGGRLLYILGTFLIYLPFEVLRVMRSARRHSPDLVYGLNWQGAIVGRVVASLLHLPLVTRFHGVTLRPDEVHNWKIILKVFDEYCALRIRSDAVIMTDDGTVGNQVLQGLDIPAERVHFWMNGLDIDDENVPPEFDRDQWRKEHGWSDRRIVLMVSRLATWKRVDRGIACLMELLRDGIHNDVLLVIVGEGSERGALESLALKSGVAENIRFEGAVGHDRIGEYFASSDVFLSLYDISNLGNPLLEAVWLGLPVVSIRNTGVETLIEDGKHGYLVELSDLEGGVSRSLRQLLNSEDSARQIRDNLRELRDMRLYSWEGRMMKEHQLILQLLGQK